MPRIACLLVPDLPIAAACRADPDLAGRPLALSAGTGTHAPIVAAAAAARASVPGEAGLGTARGARAGRVGLAARAAVGASMTVARLAALHATEVVPAGTELGFLAPLPLACLAPPPAIAATLERWGIRRLGDLARLPVAEVATRLGPAGAALVRTARGEDERPLAPQALGGPGEAGIDPQHAAG